MPTRPYVDDSHILRYCEEDDIDDDFEGEEEEDDDDEPELSNTSDDRHLTVTYRQGKFIRVRLALLAQTVPSGSLQSASLRKNKSV